MWVKGGKGGKGARDWTLESVMTVAVVVEDGSLSPWPRDVDVDHSQSIVGWSADSRG